MATKTYQADTMMEALKMVQDEMGPDAIVVSVRDIKTGPSWQVWKGTGVEVVAMGPDAPQKAGADSSTPQNSGTLPGSGALQGSARQPARQQPVIRPSATGKGIEFIEDRPRIDWEDVLAAVNRPQVNPANPAEPDERSGPAAEKKGRVWQPQVIRKEKEREPSVVDRAALFRGDTAAANVGSAPGPETLEREPGPTPIRVEWKTPVSRGTASPLPPASARGALLPLQQRLLAQGLEKEYVEWLGKVAVDVLPSSALQDEEQCKAYLRQQLEAELHVQPKLVPDGANQAVVLVGASGNGKTATVAKLAFFYRNVLKKEVVWVSADTIRTGAVAETRAFTDAIGVPLRLVYSPADLATVLSENQEADFILIDTPGYNPYCENQMVELGTVLTEIPNRFTYLVAAATMKDADLNQAAASLGLFSLKGLILTKLDETLTFGSVYNLARNSKIPMAFFCTGKEANGNLQTADAGRLVSGLFGKGWTK